jgi:hypothetical protein
MFRLSRLATLCTLALLGYSSISLADQVLSLRCNDRTGYLCAETFDSIGYAGEYTGHDEPAVLFYSNQRGSGNSSTYHLRVPKDPPTLPTQDGKGGTFNFELHPAFWVSMAVCDDQSAPNPGGSSVGPNIRCRPDSDRNIFDGTDSSKADYIGKHPGTGFVEMQFYPPGWVSPCGAIGNRTQWCSALNIDSLSINYNANTTNNDACLNAAGQEYVNFAFITKSGKPTGPPSPLLANGATFTPNADTLFYNPGDELRVTLEDTQHGLKVTIVDLTTGERGTMVASAANGFAQVLFDPNGTDCNPATHNIRADFHPMYATSSEHTRVPWAAHSYNISFSDEIGHFEFCNAVDSQGGNCTVDGVHDRDDGLPPGAEDDQGCFDGNFTGAAGLIAIGGCTATDFDFDGVPYLLVWPGTLKNVNLDRSLHARPVEFTSPLFRDDEGEARNYSRVAFEADLPRIESNTNPICQRHLSNPADPNPGQGCVNPPKGADFYPFFTTARSQAGGGEDDGQCVWHLGGPYLPGTTNTFGGSSAAEYGPLLQLAYPATGGQVTVRLNDFRRILPNNPCTSRIDRD